MIDFSRNVYCVFGLPFDAVTLKEASMAIAKSAENRQRCFFSTPNLNFLIGSLRDKEFRDSVLRSDLSLPDGMPIVWLAKFIGVPINERVAGSDVFNDLCSPEFSKLNVYFFGGLEGVAGSACEKLNSSNGALTCVGFSSPGFGSIDEISSDQVLAEINCSNADILVVALGAAKGQAWIEHNLPRLEVPVVSHLGAVVNFVGGTVSRAPAVLQKIGLEWVWRIKEEPKIWRRYFHDGMSLLYLLFRKALPAALFYATQNFRGPLNSGGLLGIEHSEGQTVARLAGNWSVENISLLRECLVSCVALKQDIILDLVECSYVDSSTLGLFMIAFGYQSSLNLKFIVRIKPGSVRKQFSYMCVDYLLDNV